jgi:hypothetical protein
MIGGVAVLFSAQFHQNAPVTSLAHASPATQASAAAPVPATTAVTARG